MPNTQRLDQIVDFVDERGFLSVVELSELLEVSQMTIRRDLDELEKEDRLKRTFGGAVSTRSSLPAEEDERELTRQRANSLVEQVDVLIATALNPKSDSILLETVSSKKTLPIIGESLSVPNEATVVAVDNYAAGFELGAWAGDYANQRWDGKAFLLDLTYYLANTQMRSRGFIAGLEQTVAKVELVLSLDAQSRYETAYQLTRDALTVHPHINLIFTINDITAWGAINACIDLGIEPDELTVLPFGLEGDTLKNALRSGKYCQAGLAMFPEIIGPICVEAAIRAYNQQDLPAWLVTPHKALDRSTLDDFYRSGPEGWKIRWENVRRDLTLPVDIFPEAPLSSGNYPQRIGLVVPFSEHEWYQSLAKSMRAHAKKFAIEFVIIDVHQSLKDEIEMRQKEIACVAAADVQPGEVILIDSGPISRFLAQMLLDKKDLTVITNAMPVFEILRGSSEITLILTGGVHRQASQTLVGPTAENALKELRADKLFLSAAGVSQGFGLSHTHVSEVTMKQAMLRAARQIILLADHTNFGQESVVQIAPLNVVDKIITDDALSASMRLELNKLGIEIVLAST